MRKRTGKKPREEWFVVRWCVEYSGTRTHVRAFAKRWAKTNNPVMFGKRIIMRSIYDVWGNGQKYVSTSHNGANKLDDIMRVLCILDGKPEPDHRQGAYYRLDGAKLSLADFDGYFTVKGFKNGNGHLTFNRPDLVDKMNQIVAKHFPGALPPGREAV